MYTNGHISQVTAYSFRISITFAFTFAFRLGEPWTPRRREDDSAVVISSRAKASLRLRVRSVSSIVV